jgi:hypothetical protein
VELEEGAVRLWLPDGASAQQAYEEMAARLGAVMGGPEILVGVTQDRLFDRSSGSASAAAPATSWATAPSGSFLGISILRGFPQVRPGSRGAGCIT